MFEEIVKALIQSGMTESGIAERVGSSQPSINRIRNGKQQPGYALGVALIALANEVAPTERSDDVSRKAAA